MEVITFSIDNTEAVATEDGDVKFTATTDQNRVITFWDSDIDDVVIEVSKDFYKVILGTYITGEGELIPNKQIMS